MTHDSINSTRMSIQGDMTRRTRSVQERQWADAGSKGGHGGNDFLPLGGEEVGLTMSRV